MKNRMLRIAAAALPLLAAGCTDAMEPRITASGGPSANHTAFVSVSCPTYVMEGTTTGYCMAAAYDRYGNRYYGTPYWSSSAPSILDVSFTGGNLYANSPGTAQISAFVDGVYGYATVTVISPVQAYITGPSTITQAGTHTWTANPYGGTGSYTYAWETFNGSTWTPAGSSQSLSAYFDWATAPFQQLRVTVTSAGTAVATHSVSANIPRPAPTVYISGPSAISAKSTYQFTAHPGNFDTPAYSWYERDCTGSSCTGWTNIWNGPQVYTRVLSPADCSVQVSTWELRVVVSGRSDGLTAQADHSVYLCKDGPPID